MENKLYWIWLSLVFKTGSNKPKRIVNDFGPPEEFYQLSREGKGRLGFLTKLNLDAAEHVSLKRAEIILDDCKRLGISVVTYGDLEYPERLRGIYGAPMVLYVLGSIAGLDEEPVIAVVGTRKQTDYSNSVTGWLARGLAEAGAVVVSGCAVGCDTAAMVGALQGGGRIIGVMGCGLDVDYPKENHGLKKQVLKQGGALLSELPPGTPVQGRNFPVRNRILAGLSLGVVVTQAPERSGALITADHALENGRDVYCVPPYSIFDANYYGVIEYIRQGATPVFSPDDILGSYVEKFPQKLDVSRISGDYIQQKRVDGKQERISVPKPEPPAETAGREEPAQSRDEADKKYTEVIATFDENQLMVYNNLEKKPRHLNELAELTGLRVGALLSILTELEIEGVAEAVAGGRYALR